MTLTPEQLRQGYFDAIKAFTNNFNDIEVPDRAPLPIQIAVEKMVSYSGNDATIKSESISDLSQTFHDVEGWPNDIRTILYPYCKVRF